MGVGRSCFEFIVNENLANQAQLPGDTCVESFVHLENESDKCELFDNFEIKSTLHPKNSQFFVKRKLFIKIYIVMNNHMMISMQKGVLFLIFHSTSVDLRLLRKRTLGHEFPKEKQSR